MATACDTSVYIRWMISRDLDEVLAIERQSYDWQWTRKQFITVLRMRNCIDMVAEHNDHIAWFMVYEVGTKRITVLNFAVRPDLRRHGIGTKMVDKLVGKLSSRRRRIALITRETNLAAQLFFRSCGFRAVSILRGYYDETAEDAYEMVYRLTNRIE